MRTDVATDVMFLAERVGRLAAQAEDQRARLAELERQVKWLGDRYARRLHGYRVLLSEDAAAGRKSGEYYVFAVGLDDRLVVGVIGEPERWEASVFDVVDERRME